MSYACPPTSQEGELQARAQRALDMLAEGYSVAWVKGKGLVAGPAGQVYVGDLDSCSCPDRQFRRLDPDNMSYHGPCKHSLFRALDLLLQAGRAGKSRLRAERKPRVAVARVAAAS